MFPIELPDPSALAELIAEARSLRDPAAGPFDVVISEPPGTDFDPWIAAGATWCLTGFGQSPRRDEVLAAIDAGPG
jgi:hypothetical protein